MVREQYLNNNCKSSKGWTGNEESAFRATLLIRNFPLEFTEDACLSCHCSTESTTETSKAHLAISVTPMSTHTHTHEGQLHQSTRLLATLTPTQFASKTISRHAHHNDECQHELI
jgi:hypothetical protein